MYKNWTLRKKVGKIYKNYPVFDLYLIENPDKKRQVSRDGKNGQELSLKNLT